MENIFPILCVVLIFSFLWMVRLNGKLYVATIKDFRNGFCCTLEMDNNFWNVKLYIRRICIHRDEYQIEFSIYCSMVAAGLLPSESIFVKCKTLFLMVLHWSKQCLCYTDVRTTTTNENPFLTIKTRTVGMVSERERDRGWKEERKRGGKMNLNRKT